MGRSRHLRRHRDRQLGGRSSRQTGQHLGQRARSLAKAQQFGSRFAARAFRRPLTVEEEQLFVRSRFANGKPAADSIKEVVLLTLKSPRFPDLGQADDHRSPPGSRLACGTHCRTRRLASGGRRTPAHRQSGRQQALRMLRHPAQRPSSSVMHHWLGLDHAEEIAKDTEMFPEFDKLLEADLRTSLNLFLDEVVWQEAARFSRPVQREPSPDEPAPGQAVRRAASGNAIRFFAGDVYQPNRAGLLTHPYLLTLYSYHNSTSPIHRGVFVTRHLLGARSNRPPRRWFQKRGVPRQPDDAEKVTQLTKADACMTCHGIINPLGFTLEQFDSIGRRRDNENGKLIHTASDYLTARRFADPYRRSIRPCPHAMESPSAHEGFVEMLFNQVAKQPIRAYGSGC